MILLENGLACYLTFLNNGLTQNFDERQLTAFVKSTLVLKYLHGSITLGRFTQRRNERDVSIACSIECSLEC